ncbi:uncharacterized protein DS421_5g154370 [Arachis hypogaea]|nr:uncharacterized protein DS421_5g154370 [Arachis hypogaea]
MEWRKCYLDLMLVPLGILMSICYHIWLWHKTRTHPFSTSIGINANARRFWVPAMLKVFSQGGIVSYSQQVVSELRFGGIYS